MGIFSNRCEALVNPVTGKALYGAALEEARQKPNWPRCGYSVKKAAHVCSMCGAPAPGGWWRCPTCGKWVGSDSRFCAYCNAPLHPDERLAIAGGVWHKTPEIFAQRIEVSDISTLSQSGLQVQAGTVAILLDAGAVKDILDAGRYNLESLARKINWFNNPPPRSVVLMDSGEVALPISFDGVLTKSKELAKAYVEVIVRFVGGKDAAANFIANVLKGERSFSFANIVDRLEPLFRLAVADMCAESTLEELAGDLWRRARLRDTIMRLLEDDLQATGLSVVRISSCEFTNPEYEARVRDMVEREKQRRIEELEQRKDLEEREKERQRMELERQKAAEAFDMRKRQAEFEAARQAFERELMLGKFKSDGDFRRAKAALEDEFNLGELERKDNWRRLMEKRADEDAARQRAREKAERAYREQEEEEERQKAAIQAARQEKERAEEELRRNAALDRRWRLEDRLNSHARAEELRRFKEAEERRARRWEAVKDEALRLWEKKKEEWRQEDERRAREQGNELVDVQHAIRVDEIKTDADISKRTKITTALNEELIRKAETDSSLKEIEATGEGNVRVIKAQADAKVKDINARSDADASITTAQGRAKVKVIEAQADVLATRQHRDFSDAEDEKLRNERAQLKTDNKRLREELKGEEDEDVRASIKDEIQENNKRIGEIDKVLGT